MESITDDYDMPVGKASHVHSVSNQRVVSLTAPDGRKVDICLRAFNDGVAFRYLFPEQKGIDSLRVRGEQMELHPTGDPILKAMYLPGLVCSHESPYTTLRLSEHNVGKTADMPVLLSYDSGAFLALTEAMVVDFAGMRVTAENSTLKGVLTPRMDKPEYSVLADLPHRSPWRVFLVSDRAGELMESNVLTTLCGPCEETDLSWIKPGKATWPWWNGYQSSPEAKKGDLQTVNFNISKEYIVLAMYVTLESSLHLVSDAPANYEGQPGFEFIREVPTVWDETIVPQAKLDEYVVTVRRKGDKWFVGAIGNHSARDISIPLDFLGDSDYTMELFTDAEDIDTDPNHLEKKVLQVKKTDTIEVHLGASGGAAAIIKP